MTTARVEKIKAILNESFAPYSLEVIDDSAKHIGHEGAKDGRGHFTIKISSTAFNGINTVTRHRMIYTALENLLKTDIHALSIKAQTPDELG